jgi:hypothetical protein
VTHTPGPWEATETVVKAKHGGVVARTEYAGNADGGSERANARLIAAAPDMLAVLEAVQWGEQDGSGVSWCPHCHHIYGGHTPPCIVRVAIAQAKDA